MTIDKNNSLIVALGNLKRISRDCLISTERVFDPYARLTLKSSALLCIFVIRILCLKHEIVDILVIIFYILNYIFKRIFLLFLLVVYLLDLIHFFIWTANLISDLVLLIGDLLILLTILDRFMVALMITLTTLDHSHITVVYLDRFISLSEFSI